MLEREDRRSQSAEPCPGYTKNPVKERLDLVSVNPETEEAVHDSRERRALKFRSVLFLLRLPKTGTTFEFNN